MNRHQISAVFLGGVSGASARWGILKLLPSVDQWPWDILLINIFGAAALGIAVGFFARKPHKILFLAVSTGFCGAFTTFSAFTVDIAFLIRDKQYFNTVSFLASSILGGLLIYHLSKRSIQSRKVNP